METVFTVIIVVGFIACLVYGSSYHRNKYKSTNQTRNDK